VNITVQRQNFDAQCTQGEMLLNGTHFGWTLEPQSDPSKGKPYCVAAGTYAVLLQQSAHFNMVVPVVQNVPNFTGVEIHPGNFPPDTHACCLVGETEGTDFVGNSRAAFDALMQQLSSVTEPITITYIGGIQ
jgi:hypothetical protein